MKTYLEYSEALKTVLDHIKTTEPEMKPLNELYNRISAQDIAATENVPSFNNSAMDGYAIRSEDVESATPDNPVILNVIEAIYAGDKPGQEIKKGETAKIMTGAVIPESADAVIKKEDTEVIDDKIKISRKLAKHKNIRFCGEDIKEGEKYIFRGEQLSPAKIGLLASQNIEQAEVFRKPMVSILASGSELLAPGEKLQPGMIRSSNSVSLSGLVSGCNAYPIDFGIARDVEEELELKVSNCLSMDVVVTIGGVSVGDKDLMLSSFEKVGIEIIFWKCRIKPGKPVVFGMYGHKPVFGLPGSPVSAMVSFELFVRPALLKMQGVTNIHRIPIITVIEDDFHSGSDRTEFIRAVTRYENGQFRSKLTGPQGSGILQSMSHANSLIMIPGDKKNVSKGEQLTAILFEFPLTDNNLW